MKTTRRRAVLALTAFLALITTVIITAIPAIAADAPDTITISNVMAFRNLAENNDVLILFHYDMPYASDNYTDTPASRGIIFRLNSAGGDVLQTDSPYVYPYFETNGYGYGVGAFYLTASDNYTWESEATIDVFTGPTLTPFRENSYTLTTSDYSLETTQAGNRDDVESYILLECDDLEATYEDTGIVLKSTSDAGIILSPYGEAYFQGVVSGINNMVPDLFFIQSSIPEVLDTTAYDLSVGDAIAARTDADDMGEGFENTAALFHLNKYAFWLIVTGLITIATCILTIRKEWGIEPGLAIGGLVFSGLAFVVGGMVFGAVMLASFIGIIGIVWIFVLKRA